VIAAPASVDFYNRNAEALAARYDKARFEDIHADLLRFLPDRGGAVLDVGAGSGRDAIALAAMGYAVVAVEPAVELAKLAHAHHAGAAVKWITDALPRLALLNEQRCIFDFILCSAVIMHIPPGDLDASFETLFGLLSTEGHLAISFRRPIATDDSKLFHAHSGKDLAAAARRAGLEVVSESQNADRLGRSGIEWQTVVFRKGAGPQRSHNQSLL
jgi:2-polyprenyl-3-methyl-5-hydroxy-6-metoxy-1,4-benzoquinol methylase